MSTTGRIAALALVTLATTAGMPGRADLAPGRSARGRAQAAGPQEAEVVAVVIDQRTKSPVVLLRGKRDHRQLSMTIGPAEATGIMVRLEGLTPPRPLTHDLFLTLFGQLKVSLTRVVITDLRDDVYYADRASEQRRRRAHPRLATVRRHRAGAPAKAPGADRGARVRQGRRGRHRAAAVHLTMSRLPLDDLHWALQRRLEDVFSKLGEKFGDLTGRVRDRHPAQRGVRRGGRPRRTPSSCCADSPPPSPARSRTSSGASARPRGCCSTARPAPASRSWPAPSRPRRARSSTTSSC